MGFVAATMLLYMDEASAYWCFVAVMDRLGRLYAPGLRGVCDDCRVVRLLLRRLRPRAHRCLAAGSAPPELFCTGWLMGFFFSALGLPTVLRIFEQYLCEGEKVLFRCCLALVDYCCMGDEVPPDAGPPTRRGVSLLSMPESMALVFVQQAPRAITNPDWFVERVLGRVRFSRALIRRLRARTAAAP